MGIRVSAYTVPVGTLRQLEIAKGEDRRVELTFTIDGVAVDFTGAQSILLRARAKDTRAPAFALEHAGFVGTALEGTPYFVIAQADTEQLRTGVYHVDVIWIDARGFKTQLMAASRLFLLAS